MQPTISLAFMISPRINAPPITANTDSKHKIKDAKTGKVCFCPNICNVYATPQAKNPAYNKGILQANRFDSDGVSNTNIGINDKIPTTKNCTQEAFIG